MANVNQGVRSGNAFGRVANTDFSGTDVDKVALKPGFLIRIRDRFCLVEAVEPMNVDLFFTDSVNLGATVASGAVAADALTGTHADALESYGPSSIAAYYDITSTASATTRYGNILKPDFDSGFIEFGDLEPFKGHIYQLCPTLPNQPKFIDLTTGDWHSKSVFGATTFSGTANSSFSPIGFNPATPATSVQAGTVSAKLYLKHPAGNPRTVLDEAPEGSSGPTPHTANASGALEGLSGFIDGQISPIEAPAWHHSIFIEHGENNLPVFKLVNDSDEFLLDGRIRLTGWKYRVIELSDSQVELLKKRSGGRLTFKIINTTGLPVAGAMLADYFPK